MYPYLSHARVLMKFFSSHELSKNVDDNFFSQHKKDKYNGLGISLWNLHATGL